MGVFFGRVFFPAFSKSSSSPVIFFARVFLLVGLLLDWWASARTWLLCDLGATHDLNETTQVPSLQGTIRSRPACALAPEVLFATGLPASQQGRQPAALAGLAQGPRLLSRVDQPVAGEALA